MKCPLCEHTTTTDDFTCPECATTFDHTPLAQLQHLTFLTDWLQNQEELLGPELLTHLHTQAQDEVEAVEQLLNLAQLKAARASIQQAKIQELGLLTALARLAPQWFIETGIWSTPFFDFVRSRKNQLEVQPMPGRAKSGATRRQSGGRLCPGPGRWLGSQWLIKLGRWDGFGAISSTTCAANPLQTPPY